MEEQINKRRQNKSFGMRLLNTVAAWMVLGSVIYVLIAGLNPPTAILITVGVLGLGAPSVASGEGVWDMVSGFFEAFFDGIMGVLDAISSIFG